MLTPASRRFLSLLLITSAANLAGSANHKRFLRTAVDPAVPVRQVTSASEVEPGSKTLRRSAASSQRAEAPEIELTFDDGTSDGDAILEDGLMVVTRLTPKVYPVKLTRIRLLFVKFQGQSSPAGKQIRLVVFTDPEGKGKPPETPRLLVDQTVTIPSIGEFVDFPLDGPELAAGDLYVGYQAPRPANGVGFACDTNGGWRERGFWSDDDGVHFHGPLEFADGAGINPLMRAMVRVSSAEEPRMEELTADDGTIETGLLRDGGMYVNRLTPSRYPATLKKVRFFLPKFSGQPSPVGQRIRLVVFRDPAGGQRPPEPASMDVDRAENIPATGDFIDFSIDDLLIESGDVYVGYQAPSPHQGVGFALDWDGAKNARSFRSVDGGQTFAGPLEVTYDGSSGMANLMLRALVDYGGGGAAAFTLDADRDGLDLSEGPNSDAFQVGVTAAAGFNGQVRISARTDPPGIPVTIAVAPEFIRPGEQARITLSDLQNGQDDTFRIVVEGRYEGATTSLEVPAYRWRLVSEDSVGPEGKTIRGGEVSITVPKSAFAASVTLRLLQGKPVTGLEEYHASSIYRVEGLPPDFAGSLDISITAAADMHSGARYAAPDTIPVVAVMAPKAGSTPGKLLNTTRMVAGTPAPAGATAQIDAKKLKLNRTFTFWFVKGYYAGQTKSNRFLIFYPINFKEAAERIGWLLDQAADILESESIGTYFTARASLPIEVTLKPLRDTVTGESDGEGLMFNTLKLKTAADVEAIQNTPGHELMHLVQALYGGNAPLSAVWYKTYPWYWLDEALSTWFEPLAMRQPNYIPTTVCPACGGGTNVSDNYLSFVLRGLASPPGTAEDQNHGYGASMFFTSAYSRNERLIGKLLGSRDPSQSAVEAVSKALGGSAELSREWGEFGYRYFAGLLYPGRRFPALTDLTATGTDTFSMFDSITADEHRFAWLQAPELSIHIFSTKFTQASKVPELTDEVVLAASIEEGYDDVDLYGYAYDAKNAESVGTVSGKTELLFPAAGTLVAGRKTVLLGVVNKSATAGFATKRDIHIEVGLAQPTVRITPDWSRMQGVIGHEYEFNTRNRNIPADAEYAWIIDGVEITGRNVKHSFARAGTYTVEVRASFGSKEATDKMQLTIAPDVAVKKGEVLFDVYRRMKSPVGQSNQRCQQYSISIFDHTGSLLEAGDSIAKNGAYSATLPAGSGYGYRISYKYTTPCPDSGQTTGKFDLPADRITGVQVETPPCEVF